MNLYLFNETRRGAVYGVGAYIRELTAALKDREINLCVVNLYTDKPQILREEIEGVGYWYFPAPIPEQRIIDFQKQCELYYNNVAYLLQLYIADKNNLIFHLNYMNCQPLADSLRMIFNCKTVLAVHYLDSVMTLRGNVSRLRRIIYENDDLSDAEEKSAKNFFTKEKEFFHAADKIICLSNHTFNILHQDYQMRT